MSKVLSFIKKHSSEILLGATLISYSVSLYFTAKGSVKVNEIKTENKKEVVKAVSPSVISSIITVGCIIATYKLNKKREAQLMGMVASGIAVFDKYRHTVKSELGDDKEISIFNDSLGLEEVDIREMPLRSNFNEKDDDYVRFYEPISKTLFWSRVVDVQAAENEANRTFKLSGELQFSTFLSYLGIDNADPVYSTLGWSEYEGETEYGYRWIDFSHKFGGLNNGEDYFLIDYPFMPHDITVPF